MAAGNTKEPEMYSGDILQRIYLNPPQSQWLLAGEYIFYWLKVCSYSIDFTRHISLNLKRAAFGSLNYI